MQKKYNILLCTLFIYVAEFLSVGNLVAAGFSTVQHRAMRDKISTYTAISDGVSGQCFCTIWLECMDGVSEHVYMTSTVLLLTLIGMSWSFVYIRMHELYTNPMVSSAHGLSVCSFLVDVWCPLGTYTSRQCLQGIA